MTAAAAVDDRTLEVDPVELLPEVTPMRLLAPSRRDLSSPTVWVDTTIFFLRTIDAIHFPRRPNLA